MEIKSTSSYRPGKATPATAKSTARSPKARVANTPRLDTFESSAAKPLGEHLLSASKDGLSLHDPIPSPGELALYEPDEAEKDGIDWENIENYVSHIHITIDNADDLQRSVHHMASMYVAAKTSLHHQFADREDILSEKMARLELLMTRAKNRLVSSYQNSVGSFYEQMGNHGVASELGKEFSDAIDKRVEEIESLAKERGILEKKDDVSYSFLSVSLEIMSLNNWIFNPDAEASSLKELEAAGFTAKAATKMNANEWGLMGDGELGIHLAVQYMKMAHTLNHWGIGEKMSSLLLNSFETYMSRQAGDARFHSQGTFAPYQYTLKQYQKTGDIEKAFLTSAHKYLDDRFFSEFIKAPNQTGMSHATRYRLSLNQFLHSLEYGSSADILQSITGNGIYSMSAYA